MNATGFIYAILAAVTWGLVYTVNHKVLNSTTPMALLFIGSFVTVIIILPILPFQWNSVKQIISGTRLVWQLIILGEILVVFANYFILSSIKNLGAPLAAAIEISYPLFVAFFSFLVLGGNLNLYFWLGSILIFIGSIIIIRLA